MRIAIIRFMFQEKENNDKQEHIRMIYESLKCRRYEKFLGASCGRDDDKSSGDDDNPLNPSLPSESPAPSLRSAENGSSP